MEASGGRRVWKAGGVFEAGRLMTRDGEGRKLGNTREEMDGQAYSHNNSDVRMC